jgi:hypothetical protein
VGVRRTTDSLNSPPRIEDSGNHSEINDRRVSESDNVSTLEFVVWGDWCWVLVAGRWMGGEGKKGDESEWRYGRMASSQHGRLFT